MIPPAIRNELSSICSAPSRSSPNSAKTIRISVAITQARTAIATAGPLMKLLGKRVEAVITRLLGVLLAALAAQYVIDGLKAAMVTVPAVT